MIDRRLDVLQKRSAAKHVQDLQPVADAENGLAQVVGIVQQQFVDRVARGIGRRGLGIRCAAWYFAGSTSALLPGNSTASQRSISFMTSAGDWSRGMRTGSPPAISTACTYCGKSPLGILRVVRSGERGWRCAAAWNDCSATPHADARAGDLRDRSVRHQLPALRRAVLWGFCRPGSVNVKNFMSMGRQPVRHQHAMAAGNRRVRRTCRRCVRSQPS